MACIVVVGGYAPSLVTFRGDLLKSLVSLGHEVTACAPDASDEIIGALKEIGVDYYNIPVSKAGLNPFKDVQTFFNLLRLFKKKKPEIVLAYTVKPVIYASFAARMSGITNIFSMIEGLGYAFLASGIKGKILSVFVASLYKMALLINKKVFFLNPDDIADFRKFKIIKNENLTVPINGIGVDLEKFNYQSSFEPFSFLLIARLLVDKGIREYVSAASIIKKKYPKSQFNLVGWLDDNPACIKKNELDEWLRQGTINYLGKLNDVRPEIAKAAVYVLPSYREGLPVTIMEAMAMGRPIITTDAPGCRETVLDGENGFLVPIKSVDELVVAMEKFILNPELIVSMGKRSREIAEAKYDVHKVNQVIIETMGLAQELN